GVPELRVLDAGGLNAMVAAATARDAVVVVTSGLLAGLARVELEAVLAEALVRIRRLDVVPATVCAAAMFGVGARWALPMRSDLDNDQAAVGLTRYPPGLVAALSRMEELGTAVGAVRRGHDLLWLADPRTGAEASSNHVPLPERIGALRDI
ncbi:MAG: hypothetical protein ACR2NJ_02880, partial [Acidimicrobiales bacterium]